LQGCNTTSLGILCLAFWGKLDTSILEEENSGKVKVKFTLE